MENYTTDTFKLIKKDQQHIYDINLTDIYLKLKGKNAKQDSFFTQYENFFKMVLDKNGLFLEKVIKDKEPILIIPKGLQTYITSLYYFLVVSNHHLLPLILNYHYTNFLQGKLRFVQTVEYYIIDLILNADIPNYLNKKKALKKIIKWVEQKQLLHKDYFLMNVFSLNQLSILERIFEQYSQLYVPKTKKRYLQIEQEDINLLTKLFLEYNNQPEPSRSKKHFIWNGTGVELIYVIYSILKIEIDNTLLFKSMDNQTIIDFIYYNFLDKSKKEYGIETIKKYLNNFKSGKNPETEKTHNKIIDNALIN